MSLFDQVLKWLNARVPFTIYPMHGIRDYKPKGERVHLFKTIEPGEIGWLLQWWARKAIYNPTITLSFNPTPDGTEVIYERKIASGEPSIQGDQRGAIKDERNRSDSSKETADN